MRIYQLPNAVANQIAAGEVIERPASVVKELLENSLDASATEINIEIGYGGLNQIKISDNGSGIVADDLPLAIAAHATSKIKRLEDLYSIESMGFRGEALASIASVAKLCISSKPEGQEHAMMLQTKGSDYQITPCARAQGTTIDVVDLFFNAPVRKRFLKSEQVEFKAIEEVVKRFALSATHITLTLKHNHKTILALPAANNEQARATRMTRIFGSPFVKDAIYLDVERSGMRLTGWLSSPALQRSQNDRQWIYINQRMVKDKLIQHAVKQAYEDLLHPGRFPACLLYFTINTAEVDVNVHPTKHEVRFQQPRLVHDFLTSELRKALNQVTTAHEYSINTQPISLEIAEPRIINHNSIPVNLTWKKRQETEASWIFLDSRYALILQNSQPLLVDVLGLYRKDLLQELKKLALPLASRPLLVPVRYNLSELHMPQQVLQNALMSLGLQVEFKTDKQLLITTIPIVVPYLDLQSFLDNIASHEAFEIDLWITLLSEHQVLDIRLLSSEERCHLQDQALEDKAETPGIIRYLTSDTCRLLLDV